MIPFLSQGGWSMDARAEIEAGREWQAELDAMYEQVKTHLGRAEIRERIQRYISGLLGKTERKNGWQLAELMYEDGPQGMQRLLNAAQWNEAGVRDALSRYIAAQLGEPNGIFIADETGFALRIVRLAFSWLMRRVEGACFWMGGCIYPKNGCKTRNGAKPQEYPKTRPFRPNPSWSRICSNTLLPMRFQRNG